MIKSTHSQHIEEKMKTRNKVNKMTASPFGKRLAVIRQQRGLTQEELGKKVGVSQRVIAYYEAETQYPPAGKLNKIAETLNVSSDELLGIKPLKIDIPPNKRLAKRLNILEKLPKMDQDAVILFIDALGDKRGIKI